jgi:uncharacterized OB-fold protein
MSTLQRLDLTYTLEPGELAPHVEGLRTGEAVARRCSKCGWVSFPPDRRCRCGAADHEWVTLSGHGTAAAVTFAGERSFALVRFEGADNSAVVRIVEGDDCGPGQAVRLVASSSGASDWPSIEAAPVPRSAR